MIMLAMALAAAQPAKVILATGGWAAIDRGSSCEALTRSLRAPPKGQEAAVIGLGFDADRRRWGQFTVKMGRPLRPGSSVRVDIGNQIFLLEARGTNAWGRDTAQNLAIIDALRSGPGLRLLAREPSGRRVSDRFDVRGAATAIDAAAARCSGKGR